ncbi:Deoxynucleotidyltransferase terminal-interacting protein 1 [Operophtera brumata]|uniref:Deoxynucleotidyltransferase terminal-interacting protein 1 n=1 Tax=Operophtera brumata TaxID=104452 RepID=A0A0L7LL65_OPEBR|nr:Deoxynucleotidyltransferase terminal-interacting protein 1 [Operophtera brumata]
MHRRFSLPGPVQPHSRPIAEFRASANKSLDTLRQTIQSAVTRDIDQVIRNLRCPVQPHSQLRAEFRCSANKSVETLRQTIQCAVTRDIDQVIIKYLEKFFVPAVDNIRLNLGGDSVSEDQAQSSLNKRKETDSEIDITIKRKKVKEETPDGVTPPPTPSPSLRDPDKYPADTADKEWIAGHNLVNAVGGKTYIMVLEDIEELAKSEAYKHTSLPMLGELTGFKAPQFMLRKIKTYIVKRNLSEVSTESPQPSTSNTQVVEPYQLDNIKIEQQDFDTDNFNANIKLEHDDFSLCKQSDDDQNLEGLLDADIEFLSRNLENIESESDARKAIEKLTGANPDTLTLVGDEFDLGGVVHSVPVAHIAPRRITGSTVHYYTSPSVQQNGQRSVHLPQATVTIQSIPSSTSQVIRGTVMSQGTASTIIGFGSRTSNATIIGTPQYVNVTSKSFPTGNILHNAIVSRNIINRNAMSFNLSTMKPVQTAPKISTTTDFDCISTTKDMIDNACNSSVMLKKVLTLGSTGTKSFMMQNTQKVLSTGFATGSAPPPNVTIVSSGSVGILNGHSANVVNTSGTLSATHATLSALLSSGDVVPKKN